MTDTGSPADEEPADEVPDNEGSADEKPADDPTSDGSTSDRRAANESAPDAATGDQATRVVVSYPADLSDWGRHQVDTRHFRGYLRRTLGTVATGDAWEEFVGVGCCGDTLDVPLRIEAVEGGRRVGPDTVVEYEVREACGVQGNWAVQSQGGPTQ